MKRLLIAFLYSTVVIAADCPEPPNGGIVYTSAPINFNKPPSYWDNLSALQVYTEVAAVTQGFGESDVVIRNPDGTDTVVYDCTKSAVNCAAQESMPSPDGTRIAFSVTTGTLANENGVGKLRAPIVSKIYIYDIATKTTTVVPHQSDSVINRMPDWIDDSTLVYSSNAGNTYPVRDQFNCHQGVYPPGHPRAGQKRAYNNGACASVTYTGNELKSLQIWRMNIDGTEQINLTPAESNALRPKVLHHPGNKGRIAFTSFQNQEDRCFYQGAAGMGTCLNRWWLMTMASDGTSPTVLLGGHHSPTLYKYAAWGTATEEFVALRPPMELADGSICTGNYYRGNHIGGKGSVLCTSAQLGDFQVEGCSKQTCVKGDILQNKSANDGSANYIPADLHFLSNFGVGLDNNQPINQDGKTVGGMNYVSSMADGTILATWWRGWCYNQQGSGGSPFNGTSASIGGEPLCDLNVVKVLTPQITNPFDPMQMTVLIGDTTKNEFDAHEIVPHPVTHTQPPIEEERGCYLEVADLTKTDLSPLGDYKWNMRAKDVGQQANSVKPQDKSFLANNVTGLAIYGVQNHTTYYPDPKWKAAVNYTGYERVWWIGTQDKMPDGSLKVRVPCNQPFYMAAVDSEGRWLQHDPWLHDLRPGETKTCFGCHDGHSVERRTEIGMEPQAAFAGKQAASTNPPLLHDDFMPKWSVVADAISHACSGCHEGFQNDALLWSRVFADQEQLDFPWMKQMLNNNNQTAVPRPYWSGLTGRYARQSMLVWILYGARLDGHTNADSTTDQDYPTGHPAVNITSDSRKKVVRYIQIGAPMP